MIRVPWGLLLCVALAIATFAALPRTAAAAEHRDYDCSDFGSQAEAQEYLEPGDPYGLDADGDGIACESNPCPCSSSSGESGGGGGGGHATPAPPPPPPKLNKGAAKRAAKAKAHRYVRISRLVSTLRFGGCSRRTRTKVVCQFLASGEREFHRTMCKLRVRVKGEGSSASAKLRATCRSESTLFLTAERASATISEAGAELAGKPIALRGLQRLNDLEFEGAAEWRRTEPTRADCYAEYLVRLLRTNTLSVSHTAVECIPIESQTR